MRSHATLRFPVVPSACSLAVALLALGCGGVPEGQTPSHLFEVSEEDGVMVARNSGGPKYEGELFTYEKVMEIPPDESKPETLFWFPGGSALDDDGNLYVVDSNNNRIAVFDSEGTWLRDVGREGDGPGEFRSPHDLEYVDGRLHVPDSRRRATHVFETTGEFVELIHWPRFERIGSMVPELWRTPTGGWVVRLIASERGDKVRERTEMAVFDEEGNEMSRVTSPWVWVYDVHWREVDGRRRGTSVPVYFAAQVWGGYVAERGLWISTGEEPTIWWYDLNGNATARWEIDLPLQPITDEDRAAVEAQTKRDLEEALNPPDGRERPSADMARIRANNLLFAEHKAVLGIPRVDDRGVTWILPEAPLRSSATPRPTELSFMILSPEGEYLGNTAAPAGIPVRGHIVAMELDPETEERFPVVYKITPAVDGLEYRR